MSLSQLTLPIARGAADRKGIMELQRALNGDGYSLSVDGVFGTVTETALSEYQAAAGLPSTGVLDAATATALDAATTSDGLTRQDWPSQYQPECTDFYGDPDPRQNGTLSEAWQNAYLVHIPPVYPMVWDLDPNDGRGKPVQFLTVNKRCADSLARCLTAIANAYPARADLEAAHLHWWGGGFNFRPIRGGHMMSCHALGAAIDLAPTWNPQRKAYNEAAGMMPQKVVRIFEAEGWTWGGRWSPTSIDCMHFQAAHL